MNALADITLTKETPIEEINSRMFPEHKKIVLTYAKPNIITARNGDQVTVRSGGMEQVEHEIEEWFSFEEDQRKDNDFPMTIQHQNAANIAGHMVSVLDENTVPTAADYLSEVGKRTLIIYNRVPVPSTPGQLTALYERQVYRNRRVWIILP